MLFLKRFTLGLTMITALALGGEDRVWITIGSDAVPRLAASFETERMRFQSFKNDHGVAVARIDTELIPALAQMMHQDFFRCGGFLVHATYEEALSAALGNTARRAVKNRFANYTISNPAVTQTLLSDLDENEILNTITLLSAFPTRFHSSTTGTEASVWIRDRWKALAGGRGDVHVELVSHPGYLQPSVVLTIKGTTFPQKVVVMGGHLDSTSSSSSAPGADDNASGIAVLTEVLRVAFERGFRPERTLKFMGYAAEEVGLRGSSHIASVFRTANADVRAVLQLDMTNFNGSTEDIVLIQDFTNAPLNSFMESLIDTYLTDLVRTTSLCGYACSDHASWNNRGYPATMPFEARVGQHNSTIHTSGDTLGISGDSAAHAHKFARLAVCFLAEVAKGRLTVLDIPRPVDIQDLLLQFGHTGNCGPRPLDCFDDLNGDGQINLMDYELLLISWGI